MRKCYIPKPFTKTHRTVIERANSLLTQYQQMGIDITLRTLYYRFVAKDLFPADRKWTQRGGKWVKDPKGTKNAEPNYKWLGTLIGDARLAGLIDWNHLQDRTRRLSTWKHYASPTDALEELSRSYDVDMWKNQEYRPEVWIEKDALVGVIEQTCMDNDVPYFSCRGYTSLTEMWKASMRLISNANGGQKPYIIHFGDHDPSGIDMSRDIFERLGRTFMADCEFKRVALNMDQVKKYNPPPDPAKVTDPRCKAYVEKYGDESWELDALEPTMFRELIEERLRSLRDNEQWERDLAAKEEVKTRLVSLASRWGLPHTIENSLEEIRSWNLPKKDLDALVVELSKKPKRRKEK